MHEIHHPILRAAPGPSLAYVHALSWYAKEVVGLERLFNAVTVKRRRNLARPVRRRRSAFRDPMVCLDFVVMAWLGVLRLSRIETHLRRRDDLALAFGLRRFCDHTTAHNFLNRFHRAHLRQLDEANVRLLREHGSALGDRAPILDVDLASHLVRRVVGRRRPARYRWAVAFCAGEAVAQRLAREPAESRAAPPALILGLLDDARARLAARPRLVRLSGACVSAELVRTLLRRRLPFLATATWAWALAQRPGPPPPGHWVSVDPDLRLLDLGAAPAAEGGRTLLRTVLIERAGPGPRRERLAIVTSLLAVPAPAIARLSAFQATIRGFFGHPRWPLGEGKMPSSDPRGNEAYLRLATIAVNVLRLFAKSIGDDGTVARLRQRLCLVPSPFEAGRGPG